MTLVNGAVTAATVTLSGAATTCKGYGQREPRRQAAARPGKTGPGTVVLSGRNSSYTGGTSVDGGIWRSAPRPTGAGNLTLGAGTLQTTGSFALRRHGHLGRSRGRHRRARLQRDADAGRPSDRHGRADVDRPRQPGLEQHGGQRLLGRHHRGGRHALAQADNALSPNSNLVIGDGASVVLDFGSGGSDDSLTSLAAPLPAAVVAAAPALAPAASPPCLSRVHWTLLLAGMRRRCWLMDPPEKISI